MSYAVQQKVNGDWRTVSLHATGAEASNAMRKVCWPAGVRVIKLG